MKRLVINTLNRKSIIRKEIYGHFSEHLGRCIYEGVYVGENSGIPNENGMRRDVVDALREIRIPVLRWPGGCFADEYHWKDGIGPKDSRKKMINTNWGGVVEDNSFGTHEYMELCRQLGCESYINANVGSGTVQEMSEWVEYMTSSGKSPMSSLRAENGHPDPWHPRFLGVGNENWGCGGNMKPDFYANEFRRYSTFARNYDPSHPLFRIACGPNGGDSEWMETLLRTLAPIGNLSSGLVNGISMHYYTIPGSWEHKQSATDFTVADYYETLRKAYDIEGLIRLHSAIMDRYDPQKSLGLIVDEWGTWFAVEPGTNPGFLYQQNTMRDAMVAGISLNIFNKHSDRVVMANLAQLVNVLQSVILTDGDRMLRTPTWHVFDLYKEHQDCTLLDSYMENEEAGPEGMRIPMLSESCSLSPDGSVNVTLVNASAEKEEEVRILPVEFRVSGVEGRILTDSLSAKNTFDAPDAVHSETLADVSAEDGSVTVKLPPCSVVNLKLH
ncbi:MAG: alpha-N-arabinofuranosidase [Lachnospiraceae bacterium]|jgi:alpha-N-arabinofuranosidase|nr:alpha-N-arabinofuranosidase [Lachnospiraceae bacterium]